MTRASHGAEIVLGPFELYQITRYDEEHVSVSFQGARHVVSATLSVPIDMARSLELFGTYELVLRPAQALPDGSNTREGGNE